MKTLLRCWRLTGIVAAILLLTPNGAASAKPQDSPASGAEQSSPPAGLPVAGTNPPKELSAEQRADIYMARKHYADAADYYFRALKQLSFKNPQLWNKLGIAFQQENKFSSAHRAYKHAVRIDKNFAAPWNNLGTVFFMQKKYGKSVPYYQRAIKINDNSASFHMNLGSSYYHLKKFDQAVEEYRAALMIDPDVLTQGSAMGTVVHAGGTDAEFYYYMAKAFASIGRAKEAVRYLRRAFEDGYGDPQQVAQDPAFKTISQDPDFVELMRNPPVAIKN